MSADEIRVPIKAYLRGQTFLQLEAIAKERRTTVGGLLALLADRAITPKPKPQPKPARSKSSTASTRSWHRITAADLDRMRELLRAGRPTAEIATEIGCSVRTINNHAQRALNR